MKRLVTLVLIFIAILLISTAAYADPNDIINQTKFDALLQAASTPDTYYFNLSGSGEQVINIDNSKIGNTIYVGTSADTKSLEINNPLVSLKVIGATSSPALQLKNLTIGTLQASGGSVFATGGSVSNSKGLSIEGQLILQPGGYIYATGGSGTNAYGIELLGPTTHTIRGSLVIAREGAAASIFANSSRQAMEHAPWLYISPLGMSDVMYLIPVVDLSKTPELASGLIKSVVELGSITLAPRVVNSYLLEKGNTTSFRRVPFIDADFALPAGYDHIGGASISSFLNTITMKFAAIKSDNRKIYYLSIEREKTPQEAFLAANAPRNYINLVENIYDTLTLSSDAASYKLLIKLLDGIDNSVTVEEAIAFIDNIVSITAAFSNWNDVTKRAFNNGLISLDAKLNDLSNYGNKYWIDIPFAIGKIKGDPEMVFGAMVGYAGEVGDFSYAAQLSGSYGTISNNTILSNRLSFGILAKAEYSFPINDLLNLKAGINAGYSHGIIGDNIASQNAFLIGLSVSNKFKVVDMLTIESVIGINYIPIIFEEFTVDVNILNKALDTSLTADVRVIVEYMISESLAISINGFANIDLLHTENVNLSVSTNTFEENLKQIGELNTVLYGLGLSSNAGKIAFGGGVDINYKLPNAMSIDASYLIYVRGKDMSHQFKAGVNMSF